MSRAPRCRHCLWLGLLLSAALHVAIAAALLQTKPTPATAPAERVVALDLDRFGEQQAEDSGHLVSTTQVPAEPEKPTSDPTPTPAAIEAPSETRASKPEPPSPPQAPSAVAAATLGAVGPSLTTPTTKRARDSRKQSASPSPRTLSKHTKPAPKFVQRATTTKPKTQLSERPKPDRAAQSTPTARIKADDMPGKSDKAAGGATANQGFVTSNPARPSPAKAASERDYLKELQRAIARHQRYPSSARGNHQTGVATLAFVIQADGRIGQVRVASSSGHPDLDQAALAAMQRLGRFRPIPEAIGRRSWPLRVPIRFDLR